MATIVWTVSAQRDLRDIHDHIARDSERYAPLIVERIHAAIAPLESFPESGRTVPEAPGSRYCEVIVALLKLGSGQ